MAGLIGPACENEGAAIVAAKTMAYAKAPKGMTAKVSVVGIKKVGDLFAASIAIEYVPSDENEALPESVAKEDEGKTEDGEGDSSKTSEAKDSHTLSAAQEIGLDASLRDTSIIGSMEQLPGPNQDFLIAEVQNSGPQSAEAIAMAEEVKMEFNDQPDEILVISSSATTPAQHASNEAHNRRELAAEETRRELAEANAAQSQKQALTPDPVA